MNKYSEIKTLLKAEPKVWLVTGVAGFIGSNLLETLLLLNQKVIGLDNFSTGHRHNLDEVKDIVSIRQWENFTFIEGDICDYSTCEIAVNFEGQSVDYVLHQAALGSVPRSIANPILTNKANISGFLNMLTASKEANVSSFTYAASSSTYGDHPALPKIEDNIGKPLSPYAVTKYVNELYASVFASVYGFNSIGLRYFNVFGKRQDPNSNYAAVIPKWITAMINDEELYINGDGQTSRDFCFVENVIQINLLAATSINDAKNHIYNVALGDRTSLIDLFKMIKASLQMNEVSYSFNPVFREFREGDVRHSQADISKAKKLLSYDPEFNISKGISKLVPWYINFLK